MGIADRYMEYSQKYRRKRFSLGQQGNALVALIGVNIIFFVFILTGNLFYLFSHQGQGAAVLNFNTLQWFSLPGQINELAQKPWTFLTFMFSHGGGSQVLAMLLNMVGSMLWIWAFGFILQDISGNKFIFPVYIYGGLLGATCFVVAANGLPGAASATLFGAGASTAALAVTVAMLDPYYRIFRNIGKGIPVWILSVIYLAINMFGIVKMAPASFAILGGAFAGVLFVWLLRQGRDTSTWMVALYNKFSHMFDPPKKAANKTAVREKMFYNTGNREPFTRTAIVTQKRIDDLLDKINQRGYDSLTEDEKNILKKAAETDDL